MSERTADPVRTGHGQIGSVGSQPDRGTPSIRFGYLGRGDPLTGTPSQAPTLCQEQAVKRSRVPNTSNRVLVVLEVCAGGYGAGRVGERSARGEEGLVGRFAAGAAVGVAEAVAHQALTEFEVSLAP